MRRPPPMFATCKLCLRERDLQRSHIVPEFLYKPLYGNDHAMMLANGLGRRGWSLEHRGIRERLLCMECEQFLNDHIEKPFLALWCERRWMPDPFVVGKVYQVKVPYAAFKLFHWSVLWRASVSGLRAFAQIDLGKHADAIRRGVQALDPGPAWRYPIVGFFLALDGKPVQWISVSGSQVMLGLRTSCMSYGGAQWFIGIASHRSTEFEAIALRSDGTLHMRAVDAMTSTVVQKTMDLVRISPSRRE
jgi:hypothetical protein